MATNQKPVGDSLVFSAGSGEWFNQPGVFLDMGDDVEPRPPSQWHVELQRAIDAQETAPRLLVIDVTGMSSLSIGWDFGFLVGLSKQLSPRGTRLALVGAMNVIEAARLLKLSPFFDLCRSVDEALSKT